MITVVMMAGLPCSGKTTLAVALARELQWCLVDKDNYRVKLLRHGLDHNQAADEAYELSFQKLRKALSDEQSVIFDTAALYKFIPNKVKAIVASKDGVQLKVILCIVERHQRLVRLDARAREDPFHHTRNHADPLTIPDYLELYKHLPPDSLHLDTHIDSPLICLEKAIAYIKS